jgi:hypothetical protein
MEHPLIENVLTIFSKKIKKTQRVNLNLKICRKFPYSTMEN